MFATLNRFRLPEPCGGGGAERVLPCGCFSCSTYELRTHPRYLTWVANSASRNASLNLRYSKFESKLLKMANPPSSEHSAVSASTIQDDKIDICFVDKEGHISFGNSLKYGKETPAPSTRPSLSSRSPTGANENSARTTAAGPSIGTCIHGSQHRNRTPPANNWIQNHVSGGPLSGSNGIPEDSLIPDQILEARESPRGSIAQ
jgi:hypothetical protein